MFKRYVIFRSLILVISISVPALSCYADSWFSDRERALLIFFDHFYDHVRSELSPNLVNLNISDNDQEQIVFDAVKSYSNCVVDLIYRTKLEISQVFLATIVQAESVDLAVEQFKANDDSGFADAMLEKYDEYQTECMASIKKKLRLDD